LRQVLVNLLANAVKFTESGEVLLRISYDETRASELQFEVSDTGIGITDDKLLTIFEPFEQADTTTTRRFGGTGLGLTISKRLVELLGGRLRVQSEFGKGTTLFFTIAFSPADKSTLTTTRETTIPPGLRVLVVDDNQINRRIMAELLARWGIQPELACSGDEAMRLILDASKRNQAFPLILVDGHMPGMDGFKLIEEISRHTELPEAAIMMLTSTDHAEDIARCRDLGVLAYLVKPIDRRELRNSICAALSSVRHSRPEIAVMPRVERSEAVRKVLVVEDNVVNQLVVKRMLEKLNCEVTIAPNGQVALDLCGDRRFDLILLDVQMPVLDGFVTAGELRRREAGAEHTPIVALTAHAMQGDRERCLAAGMDDYLSKPIRPEELRSMVNKFTPLQTPSPDKLLDWKKARHMTGDDPVLLDELAGLLCQTTEAELLELQAASTQRDFARAAECLHKLRGSVSVFGTKTLLDELAALEFDAVSNPAQNIEERIRHSTEQLITFVRQLSLRAAGSAA
jgi:CheY-like chemotaxis protein